MDTRAAGSDASIVLPRKAKPGYEIAAEELLYRLDQPKGMPRERARSATIRHGGPGAAVTAAAAAEDLMVRRFPAQFPPF